ncbi:hypothetical protein SeLEV6574_g06758 [Synchytrium endobioticum]|uniref:Uncharacterized protein n=1 Tax=Synchytrium endobioticum TaxID=286115 RepID=A0A507CMQ1_9FUNG|nr:hypothetical protein SeLEV6574_g06758 [Synchytrium endobioticum]
MCDTVNGLLHTYGSGPGSLNHWEWQSIGRMLDRWDSGIKKVDGDNRQKSRIGMTDEYERKLLEANNQYFRTEGYPSEPRSTTVDHSGATYLITFLPNQARIQHAGSDVVIVPLESRIAIHMEIRITGDQATVEIAPSSAFLRLRVNNKLVDVPISTGAIVWHVNVVLYLGLEAQRQAMPVLVVGDGEFGWRAPYRASPAKSCFRTAAAAGALVVFSPERYTCTFSSSMTKGMDFWSAESLPIYVPQVRLLDVTENAPRCNHRKKRQDFRSHEGGGLLSARHTKRHCTATRMTGLVGHLTQHHFALMHS